MLSTQESQKQPRDHTSIYDITPTASLSVHHVGLWWNCHLFCSGSTGDLTTIEPGPGIVQDHKQVSDVIAPFLHDHRHHARWHDDNGSAPQMWRPHRLPSDRAL